MNGYTVASAQVGGYLYEQRYVKCGNKRCKSCPHGPYWYLKIKLRTGRLVQRYLGKATPDEVTAIQPRLDIH